jgi:hypothetical protein
MNRRNLTNIRDSKNWGPHFWFVFHMSATSYPENPTYNEQQAMKKFIEAVPMTLPCDVCKQHAINYITTYWTKNMNWVVASRNNLFVFWWQFHNHVNKSLKKPIMTFEKAKEMYGL